jgi:RNA polymerase sigma-70 factor (ECF subfamily)
MNAAAYYYVPIMADENTEIARGLRRREPDLLDRLIEQYQHRLLRYLVYLTGQRERAEDFFQETWVRVLERGAQYDGRREFSAWLFAIARNLVIDEQRRKQAVSLEELRGPEEDAPAFDIASGGPSALEITMEHEQAGRVLAAMQKIPAECREALLLRFHEGMSLAEIAAVTGAPLGTVKSRLYRGVSALEPRLKGAQL